jgi:hypothetical protein
MEMMTQAWIVSVGQAAFIIHRQWLSSRQHTGNLELALWDSSATRNRCEATVLAGICIEYWGWT